MANKKKIALMTKLAIYDKNRGFEDRKITEFFRHDYVCKQNIWTRFFVFIGAVIVLALDYVQRLFVFNEDFFSIDFKSELFSSITFIVVLWVIYSLIGSLKYNYDYTISQRRLKKYTILMEALNKENAKELEISEEVTES